MNKAELSDIMKKIHEALGEYPASSDDSAIPEKVGSLVANLAREMKIVSFLKIKLLENGVDMETPSIDVAGYKYVVVDRDAFDNLHERSDILRRLENGGVDNWQGYGDAMSQEDE